MTSGPPLRNDPASVPPTATVVRVVQEHALSRELSNLCFDCLTHHSARYGLPIDPEHIARRARAHGVDEAQCETSIGNVLAALSGQQRSEEAHALMDAFAVNGFAVRALMMENAASVDDLGKRFAEQLVDLSLHSPHHLMRWVPTLVPAELRGALYSGMAATVSADFSDGMERRLARASYVIALLADIDEEPAKRALSRLAASADNEHVRQWANDLGGVPTEAPRIEGHSFRSPGGTFGTLVRYLTGWAVLRHLFQLIALWIGWRTQTSLERAGNGLRVEEESTLWGRRISVRQQYLPLTSVRRLVLFHWHPRTLLIGSVISFTLGLLVGGTLIFEGIRTGDTIVLLAGAALALGGTCLDLVIEVILPKLRGQAWIQVEGHNRGLLTLRGVSPESAEHYWEFMRS